MRRPPSGTKLRISSLAVGRRINRSTSLKSCLRPRGALLENACASSEHMKGSNSNHTDRQYCAADSITASSTRCSLNHTDKRRNSLGIVASPAAPASTPECARQSPHYHQDSLVYVYPCDLGGHNNLPGRESDRKRAQRHQTPTRATTPSQRDGWRDTTWFRRASQTKLVDGLDRTSAENGPVSKTRALLSALRKLVFSLDNDFHGSRQNDRDPRFDPLCSNHDSAICHQTRAVPSGIGFLGTNPLELAVVRKAC